MDKVISDLNQKALKSQINTHFIFNALDVTRRFITNNQFTEAQTHLAEVTKLIRLTLENASDKVISLEDEINCLRAYLEVCHMLYPGKFEYKIQVDDHIEQDALGIPPLLIQPFVENAVVHGAFSENQKGKIHLGFVSQGNVITCEIRNTISSSPKNESNPYKRKSMGMDITQQRIRNNNEPHNVSSQIQFDQKEGVITVQFSLYADYLY